jgi:hypothetical protein
MAKLIYEPDNDLDYHAWLEANPSGYVLNSDKARVSRSYPMIHGSACSHINDKNWPNYTTAAFMKVCSLDRSELDEWVRQDGRSLRVCKDCKNRGLV